YYYDARNMSEQAFTGIGSQNTLEDFKDDIKPVGIASSIGGYILGNAVGLGQVTNSAAGPGLEMYLFSNSTVAMWSNDRVPRTLTLTNSGFGVLDMFGNEIQTNSPTVRVTRSP